MDGILRWTTRWSWYLHLILEYTHHNASSDPTEESTRVSRRFTASISWHRSQNQSCGIRLKSAAGEQSPREIGNICKARSGVVRRRREGEQERLAEIGDLQLRTRNRIVEFQSGYSADRREDDAIAGSRSRDTITKRTTNESLVQRTSVFIEFALPRCAGEPTGFPENGRHDDRRAAHIATVFGEQLCRRSDVVGERSECIGYQTLCRGRSEAVR